MRQKPMGEKGEIHSPARTSASDPLPATSVQRLSVIIPCFNEERTLATILRKVLSVPIGMIEREIVIVDDGSQDKSVAVAEEFVRQHPAEVRLLCQAQNRGKGAAVARGIAESTGDLVLVQDADLEYDPADYPALLAPFADETCDVVYGSRILGSKRRSYSHYYWGGRLVTVVTNLIYRSKLTDEPTGYKVFRRRVLASLSLEGAGFEFCAEVTAKVLRRGFRIVEVPISYYPRTFAQGKKISWRDGVHALWTLWKYRRY